MFDPKMEAREILRRLAEMNPPTQRQKEEQALSFAYGNLACSTNHRPDRAAFARLIKEKYGWERADIEAWINARDGWAS